MRIAIRLRALIGLLILVNLVLISPNNSEASFTNKSKAPALSPQVVYVNKLAASIRKQVLLQKPETVTVEVDPALKGTGWAMDTTSNLTTALKLLAYLGFKSPDSLRAYISWGTDFRNQYIPSTCQYNAGGGSCGGGIMFADVKWFIDQWNWIDPSRSKYPDASTKVDVTANLPHEIGHVLQESSLRSSGLIDQGLEPAWLREGGAEFFKILTYSIQNNISYSTLRTQHLRYWKQCKGVKLASLTGNGSYNNGCEYTDGFVAVEYLIWKRHSLDPLYRFQQTPGGSQGKIFQGAFGADQVAFQKEADSYFVTSTKDVPSY
jgi:hypothetical protein